MDTLPDNLPLLVGSNLRPRQVECLEKMFRGEFQTKEEQMIAFSHAGYKIKVWFNEEIEVRTINHVVKREKHDGWTRKEYSNRRRGTVHVFSHIGNLDGWQYGPHTLGYGLTRKSRKAGVFPCWSKVVKWEPVPIKSKY